MNAPIYVLPGMGADRRMYPAPWCTLPNTQFIEWDDSDAASPNLSEVAVALCERVQFANDCTLIGSSLGGMVAAELCRYVRVKHLFLVGSATNPREVNALLRRIRPLARVAPFGIAQELLGLLPSTLFEMFRASDAAFLRTMCNAIGTWNGYEPHGEMLYRIHGSRDLVIPAPAVADLLLDAGHLVAMTNAEDCVQFIRARLHLGTPPVRAIV